MSETIESQPAPEPEIVPDAAPQPESAVETPQETPEAPAEPEPKPEPKPKRTDRHIAHLTARAAEEQRLREAAERRAEAAEALLRANKPEGDETSPAPRQSGPQDVEARARELVQEQRFTQRLSEIDAKGKTELGADQWEQAKATLTGLGAVNNQAFLQALAETDAPHKIFASLADDPDVLMDLLNKPPAAMAAKLGRMDAEMSRPAVKSISAAPMPAAKVAPSGVVPTPSIYDYPANMSMREWNKMMDNALPPHLGGKRRTA